MWIPSKLTRPGRLHNAIARPRVLELLEQANQYKLVLFRSPAGYGKTTMTAQWLSEQTNVGWFSLDDSDNDSFRFINYLVQAINNATNESCPNTITLAEKSQFSTLRTLLSDLFAEIATFDEPCYLVLDDYQLITNDELHEAMRFFIKHMPDNMTLVVTSRSNPLLGTANLRVRDQMLEIGNELLAFDDEETTRFFNQRLEGGVDDNTASALRTYVEGWPSALQLFAIQAQQNKRTLAQSAQSWADFNHAHLWDYLIEEVFDLLDSETRQFLMQVSVLEMFNDELVYALTNRGDALAMIEALNHYGLFIHPLEGDNNWFRFHHLFSEFLAHQRQARIPHQQQELNSQAAHAWLKLHTPHQALRHAAKAEDDILIADILNQFGWRMFNRGELSTLEAAIEQLDEDIRYNYPKLSLLQAWLAQSQHRFEEVGDLLAKAAKAHQSRNIELDIDYQGSTNALLAQVAINRNDPEQAMALAELALSQMESANYRGRIVATSVVGEVNHVLGKLDRALPMMQQTEKLARQHQVYHHALWAIIQQCEILIAKGYVQAAFETLDCADKLIEDQRLHQVPLHEFALRLRAQILWCWNRLDEAEALAQKGLVVLENQPPSKHLHSYSMLARVAVGRGELDRASKYVEKIEHLLRESVYHVDWTANASFSLLLYWQAKNNNTAIADWLRTAARPKKACSHFTQLQWRNIARANLALGRFEEARKTLSFLQEEAKEYQLVTDQNRNLIVEAVLAKHDQDTALAKTLLHDALILTNQTGMIANFLIDGELLSPTLQDLLHQRALGTLERHRAQQMLKVITSNERSRSVHFDEEFVSKLVSDPNVPELVRNSALTQREWQVLGLIYSGFSNEQIAQELDIAGTTIKTHIRNLYQKLDITNRKEAIVTAESIIQIANR
ncbi:HTH-type transcriptional regulator MalT [Enterovibrio paralichthyis]|uniref:HTH-type transcriptional regulator MalT n=1 Tax=Enterovibrio paralichthyis TaxID=2853805 RepID=UPI001C44F718|nr:HTH-type transcriptional regulator MalT [Enterovibrio paralichthyis]MBV7297125.1 HTH-type transcriptional regulator MalT [Enterovibrio paralichthyis]